MKIRPAGTQLFHADRRTDMTKLTVAFRNFATRINTVSHCHFVRHKAEIDWAGFEPLSQVLVNRETFGSYHMVDTHSLDYKGEPVTGNNCSLL